MEKKSLKGNWDDVKEKLRVQFLNNELNQKTTEENPEYPGGKINPEN